MFNAAPDKPGIEALTLGRTASRKSRLCAPIRCLTQSIARTIRRTTPPEKLMPDRKYDSHAPAVITKNGGTGTP